MRPPADRAISSSGPLSLGRILVVEDERIIARDLAKTLARFGYSVVATVATGEEAVQKALELEPDLALMDIHLAGAMDGIEAAERISVGRNIAVVYLTANSDSSTLARAAGTHPVGYLVKPFSETDLRGAIETALRHHKTDARLREREEC